MAQGRRNYNNIFDTWKTSRIIGFWIIVASMIASTIFLAIPVGIALFLMVFFLPKVWKDPDDDGDPSNGMLVFGSRAYKVASFMSILKNSHRSDIFTPTILLGFGPPDDDIHKNLTKSMFYPPTRLSAYWALFFGLASSFVDYALQPYIFPIWGDIKLPFFISMILSAIGFFMAYQALWTARRYQLAINLSGVQSTPAVMLNKLPQDGTVKSAIISSVFKAVITTVSVLGAAFIISTADVTIPWLTVVLGAVLIGISYGLFIMNKIFTESYRKEFDYQIERRDAWNMIFAYRPKLVPFMEAETPVPGEPGKPGGPPEGEPPRRTSRVGSHI